MCIRDSYKDADRIADREDKEDDISEEKKEKREFDKNRKAMKMAKSRKRCLLYTSRCV